jgi:hypothetical protein
MQTVTVVRKHGFLTPFSVLKIESLISVSVFQLEDMMLQLT